MDFLETVLYWISGILAFAAIIIFTALAFKILKNMLHHSTGGAQRETTQELRALREELREAREQQRRDQEAREAREQQRQDDA